MAFHLLATILKMAVEILQFCGAQTFSGTVPRCAVNRQTHAANVQYKFNFCNTRSTQGSTLLTVVNGESPLIK